MKVWNSPPPTVKATAKATDRIHKQVSCVPCKCYVSYIMCHIHLQTLGVICQVWPIICNLSQVRKHKSKFKLKALKYYSYSYSCHWKFECRVSTVRCSMSDVTCQVSHVTCQGSCIPYLISEKRNSKSQHYPLFRCHVRYPVSHVTCHITDIIYHLSGVMCHLCRDRNT